MPHSSVRQVRRKARGPEWRPILEHHEFRAPPQPERTTRGSGTVRASIVSVPKPSLIRSTPYSSDLVRLGASPGTVCTVGTQYSVLHEGWRLVARFVTPKHSRCWPPYVNTPTAIRQESSCLNLRACSPGGLRARRHHTTVCPIQKSSAMLSAVFILVGLDSTLLITTYSVKSRHFRLSPRFRLSRYLVAQRIVELTCN